MQGFRLTARLRRTALALGLGLSAATASAQTFCVFDVLGTQGSFYSAMREYWTAARPWSTATLELKPYLSEEQAVQDFQSGACDMVSTTGIRARDYNLFTTSIEAIGAVTSDSQMKTVIEALARPDAAKYMTVNSVEVAGILPLGGVYMFLNDRAINSIDKIKGKRIAVLAHDLVQLRMADRLGFQPRAADIDSFAAMFNKGEADIVVAPALAYMPMQLFQGVGNRGLVLKMPIAYLSLQVLMHADKFPAGFGQKSRAYFAGQFDTLMKPVRAAEQEILYFLPAPDGEYDHYQAFLREARLGMTEEGIYDKRMMTILKKIRCKERPDRAECTDGKE
ncbi:hypothetical protein EV700_1040 [Fluviicoccus keumensis]|uniref:TRAP-type C4-dicarboxylate transport system substrate-binding protein n=1 Tax=Fluviicoccus keumensis TaxID=1435465 RepID=A0A4Q7ZBT2_9GAMM|nr:putative solute-binding protein [Fluviicoccus keumensis]RZU48068.1 hypothetical protein EV700_1040 [Fluviicoccus keumensis]